MPIRKLIKAATKYGDDTVTKDELLDLMMDMQEQSSLVYKGIELTHVIALYKHEACLWLDLPIEIIEDKIKQHNFTAVETKLLITNLLLTLTTNKDNNMF